MAITGGCFCGQVTYKIEGELKEAQSCHCSMCRKAFSGAGSAFAFINREEFQWTSGKELLTSYRSREGAGLMFCKVCGSTLCGTHQDKVIGVTLGCLDGDPDITLSRHIFVGSKAGWDVIGGDAPQYDEWPPK